mmetsp:Transcript_25981/g.38464  ORF Transcript_25981/g.38464 Transcript_25981/m.38464 type:complete len:88 (+) Transcript_25981:52-315(+)
MSRRKSIVSRSSFLDSSKQGILIIFGSESPISLLNWILLVVFVKVSVEDVAVLDGGHGIIVLEEDNKVLVNDAGPGNLRKEIEMASS